MGSGAICAGANDVFPCRTIVTVDRRIKFVTAIGIIARILIISTNKDNVGIHGISCDSCM
jgi:hypothetical protein